MAGGKYDKLAGKTRPGTYINFESDRNDTVGNSERGIVLLPLIGYDFGPAKTPITLTAAAPDAYSVELGRSVYDATNDKMRLIREAFKKASKVIVYITESGTAATGTATPLTVTAKYGGTRGNDIHVSVVTNPVGGFDVTVYLDADATAVYEGVKTVEELIAAAADDKLVKFTGTGDLKAASGVKLAGGTNVTSANGDVTAFVDKMEGIKFNTLCFPVTDATLQTAAITKIKYMRESMGKGVNVVLPDAKSPDHEGVINVTNSVVVDGVELTHAEACAFVAGILIDTEGGPASEAVVQRVQEYIDPGGTGLGEGQANIGAHFTATSATAKRVNISFSVTLAKGGDLASVRSAAQTALKAQIKSINLTTDDSETPTLRISTVGNTIYSLLGVLDYANLRFNGQTANVEAGKEEVFVLGEVTVSETNPVS